MKVGLMLGGGGAKGSYQVGVLKALEEYGLICKIEVSSGTSIGAINTGLLMSNMTVTEIENVWHKLTNGTIYSSSGREISHGSGIFNPQPMFDILVDSVELEKIRNSKIAGFATASKVTEIPTFLHQIKSATMEKQVFHLNDHANPYQAILASASVPFLFGYTKLDDSTYVDGGLTDNDPVEPLLENGCQVLLLVPVNRTYKMDFAKDQNLLVVNFSAETAFWRFSLLSGIDSFLFYAKKTEELSQYGYIAAKRIIEKAIKQKNLVRENGQYVWKKRKKGLEVISFASGDLKDVKSINKELDIHKKKVENQRRLVENQKIAIALYLEETDLKHEEMNHALSLFELELLMLEEEYLEKANE